MNPYQPTYPNNNNNNQYPNNSYPQMPGPDFSINYQQPQQYPGNTAPMYPGAPSTGMPTYPNSGYAPHIPTYDGNYNQNQYNPSPYPPAQPGGNANFNQQQPPAHTQPGGYGNFNQQQPPAPTQPSGYGNFNQQQPPQQQNYGGYPNQSNVGGGYPPVDYNNQQAPYVPPTPQYNQSGHDYNPTANLFPNLAGGGGGAGYQQQPSNAYVSPGSFSNYEGTIKPYEPFNPVDDAGKLYKAMKGIGTNETVLIDILCRRTNQQRQQIALSFKTAYGKDLMKNVISETGGDFGDLLKALLLPTVEFEAYELKESLSGAGTDEAALVEIICSKSNAQMMDLRNTYKRLFNRDVEKEVRGDVSGYFQRILVSLINANRSDAPADVNRARQLAQELHKAGEKSVGTDEVTFNRIFASESLSQLKLVFEEYYRLSGNDIEKAIRSEMSGDVERAFLAIAKMAKNQAEYFAERLYKSMKGAGTKDRTLIRNVVLRSEIDMREIKVEFQKKYSKSLESFVKGDLGGDYKRAVLALIGDANWK